MTTTTDARPRVVRRLRRPARFVKIIGVLGRVFVLGGLMLLLFTGYLLWGTGVYTKQEQQHAAQQLATKPIVSESKLAKGKIPPARPESFELGQPLFAMRIPKLGLDGTVVQGVGREELKKGPGLFPSCAEVRGSSECVEKASYPGEKGNVAISGHRTTYGAPFFRLNELKKGDTIDFVSGRARYRYRVREQLIVTPDRFDVVDQHGRDEVTLTTCNPRFSAAQRLIIHADYEGASLVSAAPRSTRTAVPKPAAPEPFVTPDVLVLGAVAVVSALGSLGLSKRYRTAAAYIALGLAGTAGLWVGVFPRVVALMPANY